MGVGPGGQEAWAVDSTGAAIQTYHLSAGAWVARGALTLAGGYTPARVSADDSGGGWLLAQMGSADARSSLLIRLPAQGAPSAANLAAAGAGTGSTTGINELAVDGTGQGWAVGTTKTGAGSQSPLFLRVSGGALTSFSASRFSLPADFTLDLTSVSVSPNGGNVWIGNADGQLLPLGASTTPGMPRTGGGNTGAVLGLLIGLLCALSGLFLLRTRRSVSYPGA